MVLWVLLQIMYMYLHIYCKVIFIVTNSFKFLSTACHLFLKDRVVDVLNACISPYSKNRVVCDNRELSDVLFVIENKCFSWKHAEESHIRVDLSRIIEFSRLIKKTGRFTLWSKGATNHTGTWFDSSDLPNPNNNLRMDSNLTY